MSSLFDNFLTFIDSHDLLQKNQRVLIAISGGIDSVVLCRLCRDAGFNFFLAHCNFQLRGEESERDEQFVRKLADELGVELHVKKFDTEQYASSNNVSTQVAARELRYTWFEEVRSADSKHHTLIATAHHSDDNIETLLMNFFKGTGIAGLRAILPKQGNIIRPLLFASRADISSFATEHSLKWVEDSSNKSDKYTRNFFRNQLVPLLSGSFPSVEQNLAANISRFRDIEKLYHQAIAIHKKKLLEYKEEEIHIPVLKLQKSEPLDSILFEIIKDYGFSAAQVPEVKALLNSETGRYIMSGSHQIIRNRAWLIISPKKNIPENHLIVEKEGSYPLGNGVLLCKKGSTEISNEKTIAQLDASKIHFPLLVRRWKAGDYFYPLGMKKKKKVARFLIDIKLSKSDKEKVFVVEMDKKIVWVVGLRIDDRFKVATDTSEVITLFWNA